MIVKSKFIWVWRVIVGFCVFALLFLNPADQTQAAPNITTRHVASSGSDSGSCGTISQPCRTIQQAINMASNGDTILVAAGTYTYSGSSTCLDGVSTAVVCVLSKHLTILGGFSTSNWISANPGSNVTTIDGQNSHRGVQLHGLTAAGASLRIEGFTIQNGRKQGSATGGDALTFAFGGGLLADRGSVTARNLIVKNNQALGGNTSSSYGGAGTGGGMAFRSNSNGILLENILFEDNLARGGTGVDRGGYGIGGGLYTLDAVVTARNLTFTNNTAQAGSSNGSGSSANNYADAQGGGAAIHNFSVATLDNIVATGNQALGGNAPNGNAGGSFGGGLYTERATAVFTNIHLEDNLSQGGAGRDPATNSSLGNGGGFAGARSDVTLAQANIVNNIAQGGVGDIYWGAGGGGGVYFSGFADGNTLELINTVIADNVASLGQSGSGSTTGGGGGGLFVNGGQANLTHVTLAQNQLGHVSMQGIGLVAINSAAVNVAYSIVANHTTAIALHAQPGSTVNFDTNLLNNNSVDTGGGGSFTGSGSNFTGSPDFIAPGAPNYNYRIDNGSAAIDQAGGSGTAVDIDNQSRTAFGSADVGADEFAPLYLHAQPNNQTLILSWAADTTLLTGLDHYNIVVSQSGGANPPIEGPSPINAGISTSFTLSGLTNNANYTITIQARSGSNSLIASSNTVIAFPTDDLVYLPFVVR
jgi:hypothetical protein